MKRGVLAFGVGLLALAAVYTSLSAVLDGAFISTGGAENIWQGKTLYTIDAGHGGEDGGAVSPNGVPESQINLAIALRLEDVLAFCGQPTLMLRREDVSLHDPSCTTIREKKVSDLHNRVAIIEGVEHTVLVSIHQNSFPQEKYHGAQVFYAPTEGAQELAKHIQTVLREELQPDNAREAKPIPSTVYLMNHITCPAVLVECGFLTNREEEGLLRDGGYQRKLAMTLAAACLTAPKAERLLLQENLL